VPIPFLDPDYQRIVIESVMRDINLTRTTTSLEDCAQVYQGLGDHYCALHMYGRTITMYRKSLDTCLSDNVRLKLARLSINLLG